MKLSTLTRNNDFLRAYKRGKSVATPPVICYVYPNRLGVTRYGLTTSKKIGGAVERNRARRVLRAALSTVENDLVKGIDIVLVARVKTTFIKSNALTPYLTAGLTKLGALKSE